MEDGDVDPLFTVSVSFGKAKNDPIRIIKVSLYNERCGEWRQSSRATTAPASPKATPASKAPTTAPESATATKAATTASESTPTAATKSSAATEASPATTAATPAAHAPAATSSGLVARQEPRQRHQLVGIDVELLLLGEGTGFDVILQLDRDVEVADGPEDLVDLSHLLLVLQVDGGIEEGHPLLRYLRHQVILARVAQVRKLDHLFRGPLVVASTEAAATVATSASESTPATKSTTPTTPITTAAAPVATVTATVAAPSAATVATPVPAATATTEAATAAMVTAPTKATVASTEAPSTTKVSTSAHGPALK